MPNMRNQQEHEDNEKWQHSKGNRPRHHRQPGAMDEVGHWVRTVGILAPLIIGEFVKDPERKWRFVRIASVSAAVLSEGLHANRVHRQRERDKEALEACAMSGTALS